MIERIIHDTVKKFLYPKGDLLGENFNTKLGSPQHEASMSNEEMTILEKQELEEQS